MSRQPSVRPEQGSFNEFRLDASQPNDKWLYSRHKDVLTKLQNSIPQNESQWEQARQLDVKYI
jgi:hypothetical protein